MKLNKITASFIIFISILFSFTGCFDYSYIDETEDSITGSSVEGIESKETIKLNIPYISSDSLDPFTAETEINQSLTTLIYDSLFYVGNDYKATPLLAEKYTIENNKLTVELKRNLVFSDLGGVSSNDVISSFEAAKKSERYKASLSQITEATSGGAHTIIFDVDSNDSDLCSLLTFPIFKTGTEVTTNSKIDVPIGCGRYILTNDANNELYLTANSNRHDSFSPYYKNIGLIATSDKDTAVSNFSLGHTNILIDTYSDGLYQKYIGASSKHNLSNIIYLVCNSKNSVLEDANIKKAISLAIDREEIADYSFISFAKAAYTPFHPDFYRLKGFDLSAYKHNIDVANNILDSIGYTEINTKYNFRHKDGKILEFNLIVNSDNAFKLSAAQKIKDQLKKVNIFINLRALPQKDFLKAVSTGNYDIYLGECKLTNDMNLSVFFDDRNSVSNGISVLCESKAVYTSYRNGEADFIEFIDKFNEELPFIPVLYRCGSVNSNSAMAVSDISIVSDYYNNIDKWKCVND